MKNKLLECLVVGLAILECVAAIVVAWWLW